MVQPSKYKKTQAKIVPPGSYSSQLVKVIPRKGWGKAPGPIFVFELAEPKEVQVVQVINFDLNQASWLLRFIRSMTNVTALPFEAILSNEGFIEWAQQFVGEQYMLSIETSDCGRYNNIKAIWPLDSTEVLIKDFAK